MNVKLFYNEYPPNKVDKGMDLDNPQKLLTNVRFKDDNSLNILRPTIVVAPVDSESALADIVEIARFNYCYIPKFTRFYFIDNISGVGGLIEIKCRVDSLYSFKDDILASTQFVLRQQNNRSKYLPDNLLPIRADHKYYMKTFGRNVDKKDCSKVILITTGHGGTVINPS